MTPLIKRLIAHRPVGYVLVGLTSLIFEYGTFIVLFYGMQAAAWQANALAYLVGLTINFALNRGVVFKASGLGTAAIHRQMALYGALALCNLLVTSWVITVLVHWTSGAVAKLIVMGLVALWNYAIYSNLIFAKRA